MSGSSTCQLPTFHAVPGIEDEAGGAVFTVFGDFVLFQDAEGFGGECGTVDVGGIKNIAELIAGQAIELSNLGIELRTEQPPTVLIPGEGCAGLIEVLRKRPH